MSKQEQQLRNVAEAMKRYTEVKRSYNGKGRTRTYAANVDTIAETGRQLAEMIEAFLDDKLEALAAGDLPF